MSQHEKHRVKSSSSSVGEFYAVAGWVLIAFGLLAAAIMLFTSELILPAIGIMLGGLIAGLPFLAVAETLSRLTEIRNLQQEANGTNAALLEAQLKTNVAGSSKRLKPKPRSGRHANPQAGRQPTDHWCLRRFFNAARAIRA